MSGTWCTPQILCQAFGSFLPFKIVLFFSVQANILQSEMHQPSNPFSSGRGGHDLTACGCIEAQPGPTTPFPDEYYLQSNVHLNNRIRRCVVCFHQITKAEWLEAQKLSRSLHLPDNPQTLARVQQLIPGFSCDILSAPVSLCLKCFRQVRRTKLLPNPVDPNNKPSSHQPYITPPFQQQLAAAHQRIFQTTVDINPRNRGCPDACPICRVCKCNETIDPKTKKRKRACKSSAVCIHLGFVERRQRVNSPVKKSQISPFKRDPSKCSKPLPKQTRSSSSSTSSFTLSHMLAMQSDMGASSRAMARRSSRTSKPPTIRYIRIQHVCVLSSLSSLPCRRPIGRNQEKQNLQKRFLESSVRTQFRWGNLPGFRSL